MRAEAQRSFECFGGLASVRIAAQGTQKAAKSAALAEATLLDAHRRLSRFLPSSELSRLNRDPAPTVAASPVLVELAAAVRLAGELSGGLVDATLLAEIEGAGYRDSMAAAPSPTPPPPVSPEPRPAEPSARRAWARLEVDYAAGTITRPPGVAIDSGGLAKGLLADLVAAGLGRFAAYSVDCCGDVRIGGHARAPREVLVEDPSGGAPIHSFELAAGGVATSGITRRSWFGASGEPGHHVLDPATGRPAFTGVVQATALAPTALLAEVHAKWALLSGPELGPSRLPHGGVLVLADGSVEVVGATGPPVAATG